MRLLQLHFPGVFSRASSCRSKIEAYYQISARFKCLPEAKRPGCRWHMHRPLTSEGTLGHIPLLPSYTIYGEIYETNIWPEYWKHNTVSLIPKVLCPSSFSKVHNLSCTPLFSKLLLETFILEDLRKETQLSSGDRTTGGSTNRSQYPTRPFTILEL